MSSTVCVRVVFTASMELSSCVGALYLEWRVRYLEWRCALFGIDNGALYLEKLAGEMPTVLLLDRSLSMRRSVSRDHSELTRHDLACRGLEWFLRYMKSAFPLEHTSLLSFSSQCDVMVPFTRDYDRLVEALGKITVLDRTELLSGLLGLVEVMVFEWGAFAPCQAVLVTDGMPGVKHQDENHKRSRLNMVFPCQLHVVCVGTRRELSLPASGGQTRLQQLCQMAGIPESNVFLPPAPLSVESVLSTFRQLAKAHFQPFHASLKCGQLRSRIGLVPSPSMHRSTFSIQVSPDQTFPRLEEGLRGHKYPTEISVCGFLDIPSISTPPFYARHFVLDPNESSNSGDTSERGEGVATPSILSPKPPTPSGSSGGEVTEKKTEESQKPSFRVLLHGSLKCESKTALVKLGDDWYGVLFSQTASSKKSNLVLGVFYPRASFSWLGQFQYLGNRPENAVDPRLQPEEKGSSFPLHPPRPLSFQSPSNFFWADEGVLQGDITKVIRYSRKLPEKESSLVKELNKLRLVALTYSMPELTEVLATVLGQEESSSSSQQIKTLLNQCSHFLSTNKNPQDRLVVTYK